MMKDAIINFPAQFSWQPKILGVNELPKYKRFILSGMGGSHLGGDILKLLRPDLDMVIHSSYGLPKLSKQNFKKRLFIANSYSGNTEEVLSGLSDAEKAGLPILIIATGGELLAFAKNKNYPCIELPNTGIQPRMSSGFGIRALALAVGDKKLLKNSEKLSKKLKPLKIEAHGKNLAFRLKNKIPLVYSSANNYSIAYNWKIKFNETAKSPAFCNVIPELNHNEMTGFDLSEANRHLASPFCVILIKDSEDVAEINKRMLVLEKLYKDRGIGIEIVELSGKNKLDKVFSSLILADWTALNLGELYGNDTENVPMVEEFKKLMK